ncbi:MAG: two-component system response regulator PilR (NtrC family), partial [Methylophagaceae bacterium]
ERTDDIPLLVNHILGQLSAKNGLEAAPELELSAMTALQTYDFQGNVRELENILERAITWMEGNNITETDLMLPKSQQPLSVVNNLRIETVQQKQPQTLPSDLGAHLEDQEKQLITEALESVRWNKTAAAKKLGISFRALRYKLKKLDLE